MARQKDYITDYEYDEALRRYYNGLDFTEHIHYKKYFLDKVKYKNDIVEEFLEEGEEYVVLDKGYVVTNYGRAYNIRFRRFLKPKFYNVDIYIYAGYNYYRLESTFIKQGWKWDKVEILKRYIDKGWDYTIMENCKYCKQAI